MTFGEDTENVLKDMTLILGEIFIALFKKEERKVQPQD